MKTSVNITKLELFIENECSCGHTIHIRKASQ